MGSPWAHAILTDDLRMKRVCATFVPRLLTDDQCEQRQTIARGLFERSCEEVQFLKNNETGDESWVKMVRPGDKTAIVTVEGSHVSAAKEGAPGAKQNKVHVTGVFFDSEGIVQHEYAPDGQTINREFYVQVLRRLRKISSPKTTGKMAGWRLYPARQQCARTHFTSCAAVFGQTRYRSVAAAAILSRSRTA